MDAACQRGTHWGRGPLQLRDAEMEMAVKVVLVLLAVVLGLASAVERPFWSLSSAAAEKQHSASHEQESSSSLSWQLQSCKGTTGRFRDVKLYNVAVPGVVHTALLDAGILRDDPLYRFNEVHMSDVAN